MTTTKNTPEFRQDEKTKQFIEQVNALIKEGKAKNFTEIAKNIDWPKSSVSDAVNGRKNVPYEVLKRFSDYYSFGTKDWRDEKIELLEKVNAILTDQLETKKALERELTTLKNNQDKILEKISTLEESTGTSLAGYMEFAKRRMVQLRAIQKYLVELQSRQKKVPVDQEWAHFHSILLAEHKKEFAEDNSLQDS